MLTRVVSVTARRCAEEPCSWLLWFDIARQPRLYFRRDAAVPRRSLSGGRVLVCPRRFQRLSLPVPLSKRCRVFRTQPHVRNDVEPRTSPQPPPPPSSPRLANTRSPQLLVPGMLKATFSSKSNRLCSVHFTFDPTVPARQLARAAMLQGRATPGMAGMMAGMLGMGGVDVSSLVAPKGATPNAARRYVQGAERFHPSCDLLVAWCYCRQPTALCLLSVIDAVRP